MNFRILLIVSLIIFAFSACKKKEEKRELLTERIEYDVTIDNEDTMEPYMNNVVAGDRMGFLEFLFSQLTAGNAVDSMGVALSEDAVKQMLTGLDSGLQFGSAALFEYVRNGRIMIQTIRFREKWTYNPESFCVYKQVLAVAPGIVLLDTNNVINSILPLFWVNCDTVDTENPVLLTELIISDALVQNTAPEAAMIYGKSPYYLNNIDEPKRNKFFLELKDFVATHKISAYDYFFKELDVKAAEDMADHTDTIYVPDSLGNMIPYAYEAKIPEKDFARLKFVERWEYTKEPFTFQKKVMGINPSLYVVDEFGEFQGYRPLFWVVFNDEDLEFIKSVVKF